MKNTSSEESLRKIITDGYDNLLINKKINTNNIYIYIYIYINSNNPMVTV
jgi:hypothetical protein